MRGLLQGLAVLDLAVHHLPDAGTTGVRRALEREHEPAALHLPEDEDVHHSHLDGRATAHGADFALRSRSEWMRAESARARKGFVR